MTEPNALRYSPIFGIVKAGISYLKAFDWSLNWRELCCETWFTDGLRIAKARHMGSYDVYWCKFRVQSLQVAKCLIQKFLVSPGEFDIVVWHIVRHINHGFIAHRPQVRKFDNSWNSHVRFAHIHPEMWSYRSLQLENQAANTHVHD